MNNARVGCMFGPYFDRSEPGPTCSHGPLHQCIAYLLQKPHPPVLSSHQTTIKNRPVNIDSQLTMFVALALPASTNFIGSIIDRSDPVHVHHLYMHFKQAGLLQQLARRPLGHNRIQYKTFVDGLNFVIDNS